MNIGIAGAGIMGRVLAWQLTRAGHCVTLFDRDRADGGSAAAFTAAGMLTPLSEADSAETEIVTLGLRSLQLWPTLIDSLGQDVGFHQTGSLILAHAADASDLRHFRGQLAATCPDDKTVVDLNQRDLHEYEPSLANHFRQACYIPNEAWLAPEKALTALRNKLQSSSAVTWLECCDVQGISPREIVADNITRAFDIAVDCRGLGAKPALPSLRGVRGELLWLRAPEVEFTHAVRLIHPRYRLYIVPREDNIFVVGATQIESDYSGPITVRSTLELLSAAYSVHPGFAEAEVIETRVNCRPALPDNLPIVDYQPGLLTINGLFRHGFLLAPALAEHAMSLIDDRHSGPSTPASHKSHLPAEAS